MEEKYRSICENFADVEASEIGASETARKALQKVCMKGVTTAIDEVTPIVSPVCEKLAYKPTEVRSLKCKCEPEQATRRLVLSSGEFAFKGQGTFLDELDTLLRNCTCDIEFEKGNKGTYQINWSELKI